MGSLHFHRDAQVWHNLDSDRPVESAANILTLSESPRTPSDTVVRVRTQGTATVTFGPGSAPPPLYFFSGVRLWLMVTLDNDSLPDPPAQPSTTDHVMAVELMRSRLLGTSPDGDLTWQWELPETLLTTAQRNGDGTGFRANLAVWMYFRDQWGLLSGTWSPNVRWETYGITTVWWGTTVTP